MLIIGHSDCDTLAPCISVLDENVVLCKTITQKVHSTQFPAHHDKVARIKGTMRAIIELMENLQAKSNVRSS